MKHIIELETLILAFEELTQDIQNGDFVYKKMLLNVLNQKMTDLAKVQYFYTDEATTIFQLKQRIAQLAEFRNKLYNIRNYIDKAIEYEKAIIEKNNYTPKYTPYDVVLKKEAAIQEYEKIYPRSWKTMLSLLFLCTNIRIEEKRLKKLLPKAEPEQQQKPEQETPHTKLVQKIIDEGLLICFEPKEPDNNNLAEQICLYINKTLDAQKDGKKRYQDILKKGIDEHPNHIFGKFEPYVIIDMFEDFGIELHYDTVARWRKIWNNPNKDKKQKA